MNCKLLDWLLCDRNAGLKQTKQSPEHTLREKCSDSEIFWPVFSRIWTEHRHFSRKHQCPNLFDTRLSLILSCIMLKKKIKCTLKVLRCSKVNIGFLSIENPDEILQRNEIIYPNLVNYSEIRNIFCSRHVSS